MDEDDSLPHVASLMRATNYALLPSGSLLRQRDSLQKAVPLSHHPLRCPTGKTRHIAVNPSSRK